MKVKKQHDHPKELLQAVGIRPTRQRTALATLLFDGCDKHMTAEQIHAAIRKNKTYVSLATVYNTLHQFTKAGLLHEVVIDSNRVYFDTNIGDHYHFFDESSGELHDIPATDIKIAKLPKAPSGHSIDHVDVVIRLKPSA
ncbi:MAG: iron response transcriptional regulator IrrA [Alphaproteobacteria bacterium]